jgi:hypothetical protein
MKALLHEIIAGADIRLDRVRARQVIDLFWIRPAFWPKDQFSFFRSMATLDSLADAFTA